MTSNGSPPPNWYPDPATSGLWRYWDGGQWTEHTTPTSGIATIAPAHAPGGGSAGPAEAIHWLVPVGRSMESIAAGYLGLLCLFFALVAILPFVFIVALPLAAVTAWLAIRALGKASAGGHGRGRAIFGLIGAGLATLAALGGMIITFTQW